MAPCVDCGQLIMLPRGDYGELAEGIYVCFDCLVVRAKQLDTERKDHEDTESALRAENERLRHSQFGAAKDERIRALEAEIVELKTGGESHLRHGLIPDGVTLSWEGRRG